MSLYICDTCQFENFLFEKKYCHVVGFDCATCQANIGCFQFSPSIYKIENSTK